MALQKEIWINSITEALFADNTFAARSIDHSGFVNNKTVHVPNAGAMPPVSKIRPFAPGATITAPNERTDADLTYDIETYYIGPIGIAHADAVELSYSKRESVLAGIKASLADSVYRDLIYRWIPAGGTTVATTGASTPAYIPSATGNRKAITKKDVLSIRTQFDKWDIPQEGRHLLLDAVMYNQLLDALTETEASASLASANAQTGVVGKLYGFDIYLRSTVAKATNAGVSKLWSATAAATDSAAAIAWSSQTVSRALGEVTLYDNQGDAILFGDVMSGEVRTGGSFVRNDKMGVVLLYQGTV
jgi:hypothetical protein